MTKKNEMTLEKLAEMVEKGFSGNQKQFSSIDKRFTNIDKRFTNIDKRFTNIDKRFSNIEKQIDDLAIATAHGFADTNEKITVLEKDMGWVKDVLEKHSGMLIKLDQERIFSISRVDRIEKSVEAIKVKLGMIAE